LRPFTHKPPLSSKIKYSARENVLSQWRRINLSPLEKAKGPLGKPVANLLPSVLKQIGLDKRQSDLEILKVWNQVMDPEIVARAKPVNLHKGTLFVTVDNSAWLSEIVRYRSREILNRLQHSFGKDLIQRVSYRAG
jgi:hypothetical protein